MSSSPPFPTPGISLGVVGVLATPGPVGVLAAPGVLIGCGGVLAEAFLVLGDLDGVTFGFESLDAIPGKNIDNVNAADGLLLLTTQCFHSKPGI